MSAPKPRHPRKRLFAVLRQDRHEADLVAHPEAADHLAGELETLAVGGTAAMLAYAAGALLQQLV